MGLPSATATAFVDPTKNTISFATPGSEAYGRFDLFTVLEHEIGHILAFYPSNPGYASHLQTLNGTQYFVAADFSVPVAPGGELDPNLYPDDVMAATLAPGVRKMPAPLELQIISTPLWTLPSQLKMPRRLLRRTRPLLRGWSITP